MRELRLPETASSVWKKPADRKYEGVEMLTRGHSVVDGKKQGRAIEE
jgi:hypothetical protein